MPNNTVFDVLSPDGISIHPWRTYRTQKRALLAAKSWARRFEWQGFYSTARWERIPLDEIVSRCRIIEIELEDEE